MKTSAAWACALALAAQTAALSPAWGARAPKKPDYSAVGSVGAARALADRGKLVAVHLFPTELGGSDDPHNIVYVPPETAEAQSLVTGTLIRLTRERAIDSLDVRPDYRGDSVVPTRIAITTSHRKKPGTFNATIEIW